MGNLVLVMHFNAFTGKLESGYLMHRASKQKSGQTMTPSAILAHLAEHPDTRYVPA